jgi:hypothetical protein
MTIKAIKSDNDRSGDSISHSTRADERQREAICTCIKFRLQNTQGHLNVGQVQYMPTLLTAKGHDSETDVNC